MPQIPSASDTLTGKEIVHGYLQDSAELKRCMEAGELFPSFPTAQLRRAGMAQEARQLLSGDSFFDPDDPDPTRKPAGRF